MTRVSLDVGEVGKVSAKRLERGKWRASARVCVARGKLVQVQALGTTEADARKRAYDRARSKVSHFSSDEFTPDTTLAELVEAHIAQLRLGLGARGDVRTQTIDQYATVVRILRGENRGNEYPIIGELPLSQCKPSKIHKWLADVSMVSPSTGKRCKIVLQDAFELAIVSGLEPDEWKGGNPASGARLRRAKRHHAVALTPAELKAVRTAVREWQTPRKRTDLVGIVDMLIATGMRPNEVLALRWEDVDLLSTPATVSITGTVVELAGTTENGGGLHRQEEAKTEAGYRSLVIPQWCANMLTERMVSADNPLVFPNEDGGLLSLRNIGSRWRDARGEALKHVSLYDIRRTVATMLARAVGDYAAAAQLGHESPAVTNRHYIERLNAAGDYTAVLESLAPSE